MRRWPTANCSRASRRKPRRWPSARRRRPRARQGRRGLACRRRSARGRDQLAPMTLTVEGRQWLPGLSRDLCPHALEWVSLAILSSGRSGRRQTGTPTNSLPNPIARSRTGARCRKAGPGARPAPSISTPTAPASGSRERCGDFAPPSRRSKPGSAVRLRGFKSLDPILKFDASGKLVKSFGAGLFLFPHGIHVDRDGNVWVTDGRGHGRQGPSGLQVQPRRQAADDARQGRRAPAAAPTTSISRTTSSSRPTATSSSPTATARDDQRAHREVRQGRQVHQDVGQAGHRRPASSISRTRSRWIRRAGCSSATAATTASRSSIRTASSSTEWKQFSRPSGIFIDKNDIIYVADSESESVVAEPRRLEARHPHRQRQGRQGDGASFPTRPRRRPARAPPKASRRTRRATSTARSRPQADDEIRPQLTVS